MEIIITIIICTLLILRQIKCVSDISIFNQLTITNNQAIICRKLKQIEEELKNK